MTVAHLHILLRALYSAPCGSSRIETGCVDTGREFLYFMLPLLRFALPMVVGLPNLPLVGLDHSLCKHQ